MTQDDAYFNWARQVIEANAKRDSPCKGVCNYSNEHGYCLTCRRSLEEITAWPDLTQLERRAIMKQIKDRTNEAT